MTSLRHDVACLFSGIGNLRQEHCVVKHRYEEMCGVETQQKEGNEENW